MKLKIQIEERKYQQLKLFREDKLDLVSFKLMEGMDNTLFVLIHGDECIKENVVLQGMSLTTTQLLDFFIKSGLLDEMGCTRIETISCYGGRQPSATIGKYSIESSHDYMDEIDINFMATRDEKFWMLIGIGEGVNLWD